MGRIKPIPTEYNGYIFRSRLEARWAVFFDAAGIKYEYEPEGYESSSSSKYLPDFYLPDLNTHVEVKGVRDGYEKELLRASTFITWGGPIRRILVLSDVPPKTSDGGLWHFPCYHYDGQSDRVWGGWWFFYDYDDTTLSGNISRANYVPPHIFRWDLTRGDFDIAPRSDHSTDLRGTFAGRFVGPLSSGGPTEDYINRETNYDMNHLTFAALEVARKARFEHGETPTKEQVQGRMQR